MSAARDAASVRYLDNGSPARKVALRRWLLAPQGPGLHGPAAAGTAAGLRIISSGNYVGAFWTGGLLSLIWWYNSRTAAHSPQRCASVAYAAGAACGTAAGMWLGGRL